MMEVHDSTCKMGAGYRYTLEREIGGPLPHDGTAVWVMLNPSTATATTDDPTIRKVKGFTNRFGFGRAVVVNLYAARAAYPDDLWNYDDPIGPGNDRTIATAVENLDELGRVIAAWGAPRWKRVEERAAEVLASIPGTVWRIGDPTKHRHPRHPLYVPYHRTRLQVHRKAAS